MVVVLVVLTVALLATLLRWSCFKISSPYPGSADSIRIFYTNGTNYYTRAAHSLVVKFVRLSLVLLLVYVVVILMVISVVVMLINLIRWSLI